MKKLKLGLLFVGIMSFTVACGDGEAGDGKSNPTEESTAMANTEASIHIDGMVCEMGCAGTIEESMNSMNGIASCDIDFESKTALIKFDNTLTTKDKMVEAIQNLNDGQFTVTGSEVNSIDNSTMEVETEGSNNEISASAGEGFRIPSFLDAFNGIF